MPDSENSPMQDSVTPSPLSEASPLSRPIPETGRLAGIDYGTVRIGLALSDPERILASPYENYQRRSIEKDAQFFADFVQDEKIVGLVIGLPVHTDGRESQKSEEAREFGSWLCQTTGTPIDFFDERFTSAFAHEILGAAGMTNKKKKKRLDMIAAQIMLTAYLESGRKDSNLDLTDGSDSPLT